MILGSWIETSGLEGLIQQSLGSISVLGVGFKVWDFGLVQKGFLWASPCKVNKTWKRTRLYGLCAIQAPTLNPIPTTF